MRGNRDWFSRRGYMEGSIPACAGEPSLNFDARSLMWVYPRVCGGTEAKIKAKGFRSGLSPRVRGNPLPVGHERTFTGSIPACAGEPVSGARGPAMRGVYPRVCGGTNQ